MFILPSSTKTGCSNRATDALSCYPFNPSCDFESESDSDGIEVISHSLICEAVYQCLNSSKIPEVIKQEAQDISCAVQSIVKEENKEEILSTLNAVSLFKKVTPIKMIEEQQEDPVLKWVYQQVTVGEKPETSAIVNIKSKAVRKYLLQFNWLMIRKGALHCLYINNHVDYHQMFFPVKYLVQVLCLLHNGHGHQG